MMAFDPFGGHRSYTESQPVQSKPVQQPKPQQRQKPPLIQTLLEWTQRSWTRPTVGVRDIVLYGPNPLRNRKVALELADVLARSGWLIPVRSRCDTRIWKIIRGPAQSTIIADIPPAPVQAAATFMP
jgi:hypothetical protein